VSGMSVELSFEDNERSWTASNCTINSVELSKNSAGLCVKQKTFLTEDHKAIHKDPQRYEATMK